MRTKTIFKILFAGFFLMGIWTCSHAHEPATSTHYTHDQVEQMLNTHHTSHHTDNAYPPASVQQKLLADFPKAKDIDWETSGSVYEADFELSNTDYKAYYDAQGNLLMYSIDISRSQVPEAVKTAVKTKYPNYRIDDADKIIQGTQTFYKLELEQGEMEIKAVFKTDGSFVK